MCANRKWRAGWRIESEVQKDSLFQSGRFAQSHRFNLPTLIYEQFGRNLVFNCCKADVHRGRLRVGSCLILFLSKSAAMMHHER